MGKRKASDDAPGSERPPPPRRRRVDGNDDENSSLSDNSGSSRSDMMNISDTDDESYWSHPVPVHVGGGDSSEVNEIARTASNMMLRLNLRSSSHVPAQLEELSAAAAQAHSPPPDDQHADAEVQQPPLADQSAAAEVADQSVAAAAPAPQMVVPAAESSLCSRCRNRPASVCLVPVELEHACFSQPCRSSGWSYCTFCDGPRR